jgi:hypothetical protein
MIALRQLQRAFLAGVFAFAIGASLAPRSEPTPTAPVAVQREHHPLLASDKKDGQETHG